MKQVKLAVMTSAFALASAFSLNAQAAECSGYDVLVNQTAETIEVADGHSMLVIRSSSIVITNDPNNIYNETTGECSGTILFMPDGSIESSGHCARKDKDGDTYSVRWAQAAGADKGTWSSAGGTGKFAGQNNSGWWQGSVTDGAMSTSVWGGECN